MSETEVVRKVPLLVEVIGEPASGKTDLASRFPMPVLFDTTPKGEAYKIFSKYHPDWKSRYYRVRVFEDFDRCLKQVETNKTVEVKTVVVDTSPDLRSLGAEWWLKQLQKSKPDRKALMPEEWGAVNDAVNKFIEKITEPDGACMNLVLTSQMQDEWVDRKTTGRRIRKGVPTMNFQADIRLYLQVIQKVDEFQKYVDEWERTCRVIKNRFRNQADKGDWRITLTDLSWKGIKELSKLRDGEVVE